MAFPNLDLARMRFTVQVKSDLPDRRPDIADVLYGVHRCSHGHGEDLPSGFELVDYINNYTFRFQAGKDGTLRLPAAAALGPRRSCLRPRERWSARPRKRLVELVATHVPGQRFLGQARPISALARTRGSSKGSVGLGSLVERLDTCSITHVTL